MIVHIEYKNFLTYFLFILLQQPYMAHSNICSRAFNESKKRNKDSQQERVVEPNTTTKDKAAHLPERAKSTSYSMISSSLDKTVHPSERTENQSRENNGSNKNHSPINEASQSQLEEWLEQEVPEVSEFFQQHHTIVSHSTSSGIRTFNAFVEHTKYTDTPITTGVRIFNALVEPTDASPSERYKVKMDLEKYMREARNPPFSKSLSLSALMAQKLVFQMSKYLAANGITHTVTHRSFIENTAGNHKTQIYIEPSNDTPLGRLARDFYEKYNRGQIIYDPLNLDKLRGSGSYDFEGNTINLSEVIFLDMPVLKNLTFLHELLHARIHRDFEQTVDSSYHLTLSGGFLSRNEHYSKLVSFSEMITHQQGIRILLRRLINSSATKHSKIFEDLKERVDIGLEITESIEAALTIALSSLHETWEKDTSKSFTTPYFNQPNFGLLDISFSKEDFTLKIPFKNSEEPLEIEEVQRRLEFALKTTQFHQSRYFVVLFTLRRAERIEDREKRIPLLRTLQASQILSQKFDPNAEKKSLIELENRIETIYRQNIP